MKKWTKIMASALAFAIIVSAIAGGVVLADEPEENGQVNPPPMARGGMAHGAGVLNELLGLTAEEIHDQRLAGVSLVEIAAAQGVSEAELIAALTAGITERIAQAVIDGKLTQEQADEKLVIIMARTTEMVNSTEMPEPKQRRPQKRQPTPFQRGFKAGVRAAEIADLIGLSVAEVHEQRLAGASLAQIAAAQGVSEAELIAALTADITARLAQAVTDGKLTQEQADEKLAAIVAKTTEMVNSTETDPRPPQSRAGKGRMGGRAQGGSGDGAPAGLSA